MADECAEFKSLVAPDTWVVPHQLLPFAATVMGITWKEVFLLMYGWESLEVVLFNCIELYEGEVAANALISDPVQALVGVLVGYSFLYVFNDGKGVRETPVESYLWTILFILPSTPLFIDKDYVMLYIPLFIGCSIVAMQRNPPILIATCLYVTLMAVLVSETKDVFNSFYMAIIIGAFSGICSLLVLFY